MNQSVNFNQQESLASAPQESSKYKIPKIYKRRTLKAATAIRECSLAFKLVKYSEDQVSYILKFDKINEVPVIGNTEKSNTEKLPITCLLEQWRVEERERKNGSHYRVYFHPRSSRMFRSLTQVSKFIEDNYYPNSSEKLQIRPPKGSVPLYRMQIISANNSLNDESATTRLNEEVQSNGEQDIYNGMTEDEVEVAKILAYDLGKVVDFKVKAEPEDET